MPRKRVHLKVKTDPAGKVLPGLDAVLRRSLSAPVVRILRGIIQAAESQNLPIYLVGGFVRDLMLGISSTDLDLVVEGGAIRFGHAIVRRFGGRLVAHKAFGTAVWWLPETRSKSLPEFVDFISARRETYLRPAALPTVHFADLIEDQRRRDFSINTIALGLNGVDAGRLLDPLEGLKDLQHGVLRVLHDGSFSDDPTRIFRLLRLAGRLDFKVDAQTRSQLRANLEKIKLLSGERIRNELALVLLEANPPAILQVMQGNGVLRMIHPALRVPPNLGTLLKRARVKPAAFWELPQLAPTDLPFVLWLLYMKPEKTTAIASRLRLPEDVKAAVASASRLRTQKNLAQLSPSSLVGRLEKEPMLSLYALTIATRNSTLSKRLELFARKLRHLHPRADGNTLQRLGLKPGPKYKRILTRLRAAWLDGEVRTARQEKTLLETLIRKHG